MMRELVTITMSAKQVREACEAWARARTTLAEPADCTVVCGADSDATAVVKFTRKRQPRKPRSNGHAPGELSEQEQRLVG